MTDQDVQLPELTTPATAAEAQPYIELVRSIIERVVAHPESVEVTAAQRVRGLVVEVSVAADDMGKVIGKGGRHIDAIRAVTRAAGLRQHERVAVELLETDE